MYACIESERELRQHCCLWQCWLKHCSCSFVYLLAHRCCVLARCQKRYHWNNWLVAAEGSCWLHLSGGGCPLIFYSYSAGSTSGSSLFIQSNPLLGSAYSVEGKVFGPCFQRPPLSPRVRRGAASTPVRPLHPELLFGLHYSICIPIASGYRNTCTPSAHADRGWLRFSVGQL